jgi:hypothetical protein
MQARIVLTARVRRVDGMQDSSVDEWRSSLADARRTATVSDGE